MALANSQRIKQNIDTFCSCYVDLELMTLIYELDFVKLYLLAKNEVLQGFRNSTDTQTRRSRT